MLSIFSRLLEVEREPLRLRGGRVPFLHEVTSEIAAPFLVTDSRGGFVLVSRKSSTGTVRCGIHERAPADEDALLASFVAAVAREAHIHAWGSVSATPEEALRKLHGNGVSPRLMVVSRNAITSASVDASDADIDHSMRVAGRVAEINGVHVLAAHIPDGVCVVVGHPQQTGYYVRVGDYMGVIWGAVDKSVTVVCGGPSVVAG